MLWHTDRQKIAFGLECCIDADLNGKCPSGCPYKGRAECKAQLKEEALSIVNEPVINWTYTSKAQPEEGQIVLVAVRNKEKTIAYVEEAAIIDGQWIPAFEEYEYPHDFRPYAWTTDVEPPIKLKRAKKVLL